MMDVSQTRPVQSNPALDQAAADRSAALAAARRRASEAQLNTAAENKARQAEQIAQVREAVADAVGANTRVSIRRADAAPIFLYQAIDTGSGEVVKEWPHTRIADLLNSVSPGAADTVAGLKVDSKA